MIAYALAPSPLTPPPSYAKLPPEPGGSTTNWGYVKHKSNAWAEDGIQDERLTRLVDEYMLSLEGRVREATITKYRNSLKSLLKSLGPDATLADLTPAAGDEWLRWQKEQGFVAEGIASRQTAVKVFTKKFLFRERELTNYDLLGKWARVKVPTAPKERLSDREIERMLECLDDSPNGLRDRAFVMILLSTGLRFAEVLHMQVSDIDAVSGEFVAVAKGGKERPIRMSTGALKAVKRYLRYRSAESEDTGCLWTGKDGKPLAYYGGQAIFKRLRKKSGVARLHAHLLRHTFGQAAIQKGADRALVQDMLGHETDAMTRRYTRTARAVQAAGQMPKFSLV